MILDNEWSLLKVVNNVTLLNTLIHGEDRHLGHFYRVLSDSEKQSFEELMKGYLKVVPSKPFIEEALDDYLEKLAGLFLGVIGSKWIRLHINVQRALRNDKHRDHVHHLLGVFLLSDYVLQADVDVLTLTRGTEFYNKIPDLIGKGPPDKYFPGFEERTRYPFGEVFAWAVNPTKDKYEWILSKSDVSNKHYYLDAWYWLFLFHDCGYIFELYDKLSDDLQKQINTMRDGSPALKSLMKDPDDFINKMLSFPFSKRKMELRSAFSVKLTEALKGCDHGVCSALILYAVFYDNLKSRKIKYEDFANPNGRTREDYILDALSAICMHNIRIKNQRVGVQDSPYYFLLKFVDAISDWSRVFGGKYNYYPVQLLDNVLMGFRSIDLQDGYRGIKWNILFDFSNSPHLLQGEVGSEEYEIKDFREKQSDLEALDFTVEIDGKRYQWFWFEMLLMDRHGKRFLISNENNTVTFKEITVPLFS